MLDSRHVGVPLSSEVIDGARRAGPSDSGMSTIRRGAGPAVDARSLGARSEGAQGSSQARSVRRTMPDGVNQAAVDARGSGAEAQPRPLIRKLGGDFVERRLQSGRPMFQSGNPQDGNGVESLPSTGRDNSQQHFSKGKNRFQQRAPPEDTARYTGTRMRNSPGRQRLLERSIFQPQDLQDGNGVQRHPPTDMDNVQQHSSRNTSQTFRNRFPADKPKFQGRTMNGEDRLAPARRSRVGRPGASRGSDDPEPRRRNRGAEQGFDGGNRRGPKKENWTIEERQYLKEKEERKIPFKVQEYEPVELNREALIGMAPATASDDLGMSEILGERLLLARKYLDREFIQWDSKEQKADVIAVVEKLKAVRAGVKHNGGVKKAETGSLTSGNGHQQAETLMQKLIAGEYAKFRRLGENDILGHVERHLHRNDSFYPDDEKSLLEKVRSIMPAEQASKVGRRARNEVKA